jgi:hypothetical protein
MMRFLKDEAGTVSVEIVIWMAFLVPASIMVGDKIVGPLIANAVQQAALNEASLAIIQSAMLLCVGGQP